MTDITESHLSSEVRDVISILIRKRGKKSFTHVLFNESLDKLVLWPAWQESRYPCYLENRKHLKVGRYNHRPTYDQLFRACVKALDRNGVTILWNL